MKYKKYKTKDFCQDEYFQKWILDPDEEALSFWEKFLADNPNKKDTISRASKMVYLLGNTGNQLSENDRKAIYNVNLQNLRKHIDSGKVYGGRDNPLWKIAIGFFGVAAIALGVFKSGVLHKQIPEENTPQVTLQLQDGSIQVMDETSSKIITTEKGDRVVSQERNVLVYDKNAGTENEDLVYNQLTVPYGKRFELVLSDGSHVFLNAGSSLRYPVKFLPGTPRDVFLDGEAFFEVEKDEARPFTVVTEEMNTRVYGTKFNVTSYKNESNTYTVLMEGSVGVYQPGKDKSEYLLTITPGQRAVFQNGSIDIEEVKIEKYTAWTRGELYFMEDRFEQIFKKLERRFNVQIDNRYTDLGDKTLTATFRDESLVQILELLQKYTPFNYTIQDDHITVTPE
ncbi:FecR family protein [Sinomicrobium sp. M5D2P9]